MGNYSRKPIAAGLPPLACWQVNGAGRNRFQPESVQIA
jgi:hypothetical protein